MSPFTVFLLVLTAVFSTLVIFFNPILGAYNKVVGKRTSEVVKTIEKTDESDLIMNALKYGCFILFAMILSYLMVPFFVIAGLVSKTGEPAFGYVALAILAFNFVSLVLGVKKATKDAEEKKKATTVATPDGQVIEATIVQEDPIIKPINTPKNFLLRLVGAIPTIYLWYLFLVGIDVIKTVAAAPVPR